jgi:2,3-bisphosphoglycerate-independent phosphoglycerate mutase
MPRPKPVVLAILDGWGHRDAREDNAIAAANTPCWHALMRDYPHGLLNASENDVGLPAGQMGNSEVGHMNIGSGRVIMQDLPRIDTAIADSSLEKNPKLLAATKKMKTCHLLGLMSDGGVHSHQAHLAALAKMLAGQGIQVFVHVFSDGRDTPPQSALEYIEWFENETRGLNVRIVTVSGRYYAMDRDKRWDRIEKAYDTLVNASGERYASAREAIEKSYTQTISDEFVVPCVIGDYQGMQDGDGVLCGNFRADRVREILQALLDLNFKDFPRAKTVKFSTALGLMEYSSQHRQWMDSLFPPQPLTHILGEVVAEAGLKQLRIAETEKYAHVTFFFNGGREKEFAGEERILVPSPKVATYDLKPEMSAPEVTDKLVEAINADRFDFIVVNYANTDMVGHTGNIDAAQKAVEAVDTCLDRLSKAVLAKNGALLITADHGNAEMMHDHESGQAHTAHTLNPVPVLLISNDLKGKNPSVREGCLADVAPTILKFLQLPQPDEMTGRALV